VTEEGKRLVQERNQGLGESLALVGFELARQLRIQYGVQPVRLFVSADRAPQIPRRDRSIHALPEAQFLLELRRLNGTPELVLKKQN
jgi:medium-chain acyl-[acyl-carrier-protein] hydrolase